MLESRGDPPFVRTKPIFDEKSPPGFYRKNGSNYKCVDFRERTEGSRAELSCPDDTRTPEGGLHVIFRGRSRCDGRRWACFGRFLRKVQRPEAAGPSDARQSEPRRARAPPGVPCAVPHQEEYGRSACAAPNVTVASSRPPHNWSRSAIKSPPGFLPRLHFLKTGIFFRCSLHAIGGCRLRQPRWQQWTTALCPCVPDSPLWAPQAAAGRAFRHFTISSTAATTQRDDEDLCTPGGPTGETRLVPPNHPPCWR